ncbi:prolyl-tRNA synthetase [Thermodesulfatator indicus DSM 15286]|uniref:Proline--tRNA ligase n=1 Tax=Thermodesulfatator indicus (strain DSM 15286 / JCM 11887 / CIR29812) TaxID=667014 RepID=F8ACD9_THEID|nr:proline--tRNA ligase [Thermodesulfatator indicus]AEH44640.1 prolyl-tRNA synthetase [Thermodesulfatator indicus DSM 15286]
MRLSRYFIPTLREDPAEAEVISHKLLLRAGMIRRVASGIYTFLPLGLRVLRKVENIVREEMNRAGALEVLLPLVQPGELWQETGRWDKFGKELLRFKDRKEHDFCLGPTHEEVITDLVRGEVRSYRQLPLILYQIATKFRDEIRPRFGLMRGREFIMKDAYSFDADEKGLDKSYWLMYEAYERTFKRCGLKFRAVLADTGAIGGSESHEFMVLADTGEDVIATCPACGYAANLEMAEAKREFSYPDEPEKPLEKVATPEAKRVEEVTAFLGVPPEKLVKTLIYVVDGQPHAVLIRGDHELNEIKLRKALGAEELEMADPETVEKLTGAPVGFAGPVRISGVKIIADKAIWGLKNFIVGANEADAHYVNVNYPRDFEIEAFFDLRNVTEGDLCPKCGKPLELVRGIEVGHVFKLGTKYSEAMGATFLDAEGKERPFVMGCYGIGVSRTMAAAIEQNHDENGIIWPISIAPFQVILLTLNPKSTTLMEFSEKLYKELEAQGLEVLWDERDERPGVKFKDADLIGIPYQLVIGKTFEKEGKLEIKERATGEKRLLSEEEALNFLKEKAKTTSGE